MIKTKVLFWRAGFYAANQSNSKSFQKPMIGWLKAGPSKKPLLFWSCKQAINAVSHLEAEQSTRCGGPAWRKTCKQNKPYSKS